MTTLEHQRYSRRVLNRLVEEAPLDVASLSDDHRRSLSARFRAVGEVEHRRLDAWMVERAAVPSGPFRWSSSTARRALGNAALRRSRIESAHSTLEGLDDEIAEQLARAASGYARPGSLGWWLAQCGGPTLALVRAEALNWSTQLAEAASSLRGPWALAPSDAYYDVARARTTLRGRRDLVVPRDGDRVLIRMRSGAPGRSAGPGLRADLTIDALADAEGKSAARLIGFWPEAGVALSVDGTMENLRLGARDLVRTAVVAQRHRLATAA